MKENGKVRIRGLVFDLDGLILDTEVSAFETWQAIYFEHGTELDMDTWSKGIGAGHTSSHFDPLDYLESRAGRLIDRAVVTGDYRRRHMASLQAVFARPGVVDYLNEAKRLGLGLAVASSSPRAWVEGHLGRLDILDRFNAIWCAEDVEFTKPNPDLYLAAVRSLEIAPEEAIAFEDSPNGIAAAVAAGLFCVAIPNDITIQLDISRSDLRLDSFTSLTLPQLLKKVEAALPKQRPSFEKAPPGSPRDRL